MNSVYLLFPIMTLMGSLGGFFFKKGAAHLNLNNVIKSLFLNLNLYIGGVLYVISAVLNIIALKYLPYSIVLPLTGITYIWTIIISRIMLKEKVNKEKVIGIALILVGAIFIAIK